MPYLVFFGHGNDFMAGAPRSKSERREGSLRAATSANEHQSV
jgi:hypothetical protein